MIRKRFDPELHAKTDKVTKNKLISLLKGSKYKAIENPNKIGVDLLTYKKDELVCFIEVEQKTNWKSGEDFKYSDVNFLRRKEKYCNLDKPSLFVIFNEDLKKYLIIKDKDVLNSPIEVVRNKYCYDGEEFRKVPLVNVRFGGIVEAIDEIIKNND